jgi:hypothetical protein
MTTRSRPSGARDLEVDEQSCGFRSLGPKIRCASTAAPIAG